jgi:uncharacterized membrane protein YfcA
MHWWWLAYLALGAFVGFFAGLLGIGGGMTMVPMLVFFFTAQNFPEEHLLQVALATAMATILFTSIASLRTHHLHNAVNWPAVRGMAPGVVVGALLGTVIAGKLPTQWLAIFFAIFVYYAATQMVLNIKPKPSRQLPGRPAMAVVGALIGGISSLVAAGGAVLTVPFLAMCNIGLREAIGTSAAVGFPIAVAATLGYVLSGLTEKGLPTYTLGFVYLPALAWLVVGTVLTAPLGARTTHRTPVGTLRGIFAVLLLILATRMLVRLL